MSDDTRTTHFRTCPLCEATCGLEVTVDGDAVVRIRGDRDDVFSKGFICPKGSTLKHLHEDPDRLRMPMVKRDGRHVEVSWDEAFAEIERRVLPVLDEHGRSSAAVYLGNPNVHNHAPSLYNRAVLSALGTRSVYSASTVDQMPRHVSSAYLYGSPASIPVPDLDRTDYLLMLGANPHESNGSMCTAPDFPGRMAAIRERGGKVVVVDPRRTKSAAAADEHLLIRPGGDAAWLAALAWVIVDEGLVDLGGVADHLDGVDALSSALAPFSPEAVEAVTRIDPDTTRRVARELAAAPTAVVYGRIGTNTVEFGTTASWLTDVVTTLTGNLDSAGGLMWALPAHAKVRSAKTGRAFPTGRWTTRVSRHPEIRGELPLASLAEEIDTPGEGRTRVLVTLAGNPARSAPDSDRMDAALASLDAMVSVDPYLNETTRHADVILPPPSALSKSHYDLSLYGLAVRNTVNWSPVIFTDDGPSDEDILARLSLVLGGQGVDADPQSVHDSILDGVVQGVAGRGALADVDAAAVVSQLGARSPADRVLEVMVRTGWSGDQFGAVPDGLNMERLEENPHGIDLGALEPQLPAMLRTPSGKVELAAAPLLADLSRLSASLDQADDDTPVLIGRRHLRSNNSWMHNVEVLVKGRERCTLQVHPTDAERWGLDDGGRAKVSSAVGTLVAPVEVTDEVMPSVVSLPHGWGHDADGARMEVGGRRPGVNSNVLTDGSVLDPLSGNAVLNGIPVTVSPA